MITDIQTNRLFLADCLPYKQPEFFARFEKVLSGCKINFEFLPNCKDIWAVDFMPIQVSKDLYVQFIYDPDYLQDYPWKETISDVDFICKEIKLASHKTSLIVDGGNVIRAEDKVIMCDKVFIANKHLSKKELINQLENLFQVDKLYFLPWDTDDCIGHADGMVRFIGGNKLLINDYYFDKDYKRCFMTALNKTGLDWDELPYYPPNSTNEISAKGLYLNYLQMQQAVIVPTFNTKHDEKALKKFEQIFKGQTIVSVDSSEIAEEGGVVNCISWNIKV